MRISVSRIAQWVVSQEKKNRALKSRKGAKLAEEIFRDGAQMGNVAAVKRALCVAALAGRDLDVNKRDKRGRTALMDASFGDHKRVVKWLLAHDANPNISDMQGLTALHYAVDRLQTHSNLFEVKGIQFDSIVHMLISSGASTEAENCNGETPFLYAFQNGNTPAMNALVTVGSDIWKDASGWTDCESSESDDDEEPDLSLTIHVLQNTSQTPIDLETRQLKR